MFPSFKKSRIQLILIALCYVSATGQAAESDLLLVLEGTIPLPKVSGRIDHLAADIGRKRLFVAERGNKATILWPWTNPATR
jgi:hypothetical protein